MTYLTFPNEARGLATGLSASVRNLDVIFSSSFVTPTKAADLPRLIGEIEKTLAELKRVAKAV